jgi:hypothetical protein
MATDAQITANQENAQKSTGPSTPEGKAVSCMNNFKWGFTGRFTVLPSEDQEEFDDLLAALTHEHEPSTATETILVESMAQHNWLSQRAQRLQDATMGAEDMDMKDSERQFALFLRYQTTNDRAFHRCLTTLLKLKAEKRKEEIGFESQKQKAAAEERRQSAEKRKEELHQYAVLLAEAKADHQMTLTSNARGAKSSFTPSQEVNKAA